MSNYALNKTEFFNFYFLYTTISALRKLRRIKISLALDMELFGRFTAILSYLSGAKNRERSWRDLIHQIPTKSHE